MKIETKGIYQVLLSNIFPLETNFEISEEFLLAELQRYTPYTSLIKLGNVLEDIILNNSDYHDMLEGSINKLYPNMHVDDIYNETNSSVIVNFDELVDKYKYLIIPDPNLCSTCGIVIKKHHKFCSECGQKI